MIFPVTSCLPSSLVTLFLVIFLGFSLSELNVSQFSGIEKCGILEPVPGDARTLMPWNVAIFRKSKSGLKFITSGVLISSSTVLVVFGGVYGASPGRNKRYYVPPADSFRIVAGLNSTSLTEVDRFVQFAEVSYIVPYSGHEEGNKNFHFWLYHLSKPLDLSTPYVKAPCLPFFLRGLPSSWKILHGGFVQTASPTRVLKVSEAKALTEDKCERVLQTNYGENSTSDHVWCSGLLIHRGDTENSCLSSGSILVANLLKRYFLAGITAIIPDLRSNDRCDQNTIYVNAKIQSHYEWLVRNINCGPNQFSCHNTTCLPLSSVCNRVPNCPDEDLSDEDPIFCSAQNRCRNPEEMSCGMNGKCLPPNKICDGKPDCGDGSDEASEICNPKVSPIRTSSDNPDLSSGNNDNSNQRLDIRGIKPTAQISNQHQRRWKCLPLPKSEGTLLVCQDPDTNATINCADATENTLATLSCDKYYSPKFKVSSIQMRCSSNGTWAPFRKFDCEANCGIITTDVTSLITHGMETNRKNAFPWYAAIFRETQRGRMQFLCGASLIEKKVILTAAHCVDDIKKLPYTLKQFKVVLAPVSSVFEENKDDSYAQIHNIKQVRIPVLYEFKTLRDDIAVVELADKVTFSQHVRPVCYLDSYSQEPTIGQLGKTAGFGYDETEEVSYTLKYANLPIVDRSNCQTSVRPELPPSTFCGGYDNGTTLCSGDSGGGIVFPEQDSNLERYHLKGVISAGTSSKSVSRSCNADRFSLFTNADAFRRWILETLEALES